MKIIKSIEEVEIKKGDKNIVPLKKGFLFIQVSGGNLKLPLLGSFRGNSLCTTFTFKQEKKGNQVLFLFETEAGVQDIYLTPKGVGFWAQVDEPPRFTLKKRGKFWVVVHPVKESVFLSISKRGKARIYEVKKGLVVRRWLGD